MAQAARIYAYLGSFFGARNPPHYRVFIRILDTPPFGGGTALTNSFMLSRGPMQPDEPSASPTGLLFHEMIHGFTGQIEGPAGVTSWFSEGLTSYYTTVLQLRGGFTTVEQYDQAINQLTRSYYTNPARNWSAARIVEVGFSDNDIRHLPYERGELYFADLDSKIRAASNGRRNLDIVMPRRPEELARGNDHAMFVGEPFGKGDRVGDADQLRKEDTAIAGQPAFDDAGLAPAGEMGLEHRARRSQDRQRIGIEPVPLLQHQRRYGMGELGDAELEMIADSTDRLKGLVRCDNPAAAQCGKAVDLGQAGDRESALGRIYADPDGGKALHAFWSGAIDAGGNELPQAQYLDASEPAVHEATERLLRASAVIPPGALRQALGLAAASMAPQDVLAFAEAALASSEPSAARPVWAFAAFILDPERHAGLLATELADAESQSMFGGMWEGRLGPLVTLANDKIVARSEALILHLGPGHGPTRGLEGPIERISEVVGGAITHLSQQPTEDAAEALTRLIAAPELDAWHDTLRHHQAQQHNALRTARFTPPQPRAVAMALAASPPTHLDLVFPSIAGGIMSHRYMTLKLLDPVQLAAGLAAGGSSASRGRYTLHDFRHAAASLWIEQHVSPKRVQRWMGHSSIQMTFDTYGHLFNDAEGDAAVAAAVEGDLLGNECSTDATRSRKSADLRG